MQKILLYTSLWSSFKRGVPSVHPLQDRMTQPQLSTNFTYEPSNWIHSTTLLPNLGLRSSGYGHSSIRARAAPTAAHWHGWYTVQNIFSFGDSYTSTEFGINGIQPSLDNPIGNPPFPGHTFSNGPNFMNFLTSTYNRSFIKTYNFAYGGAMINNDIVPSPFGPYVRSFVDQLRQQFQPKYTGSELFPWASNNTLFLIFLGINDAINTFMMPNNDSLQYAQIKSYENTLNKLYDNGARNFLILNIPPIDQAPFAARFSETQKSDLGRWIGRFLFRLGALVWNLTLRHPDVTVFQLDMNSLFTRVLHGPWQFPETALYRNVTTFCGIYELGTPNISFYDPACGIPVDQYFWLNTLHPTYPMHNFVASQIAQLLSA